jgi:hypothetical protein
MESMLGKIREKLRTCNGPPGRLDLREAGLGSGRCGWRQMTWIGFQSQSVCTLVSVEYE